MKRGLSQFYIAGFLLAVLVFALISCPKAVGGAFVLSTPLTQPRYQHTATLLRDGRVLVVGGAATNVATERVELRDPVTGVWSTARSMQQARLGHFAILLADGRVLCAGGAPVMQSSEIYDPTSGNWEAANSMLYERKHASAVLLPDGKVLVTGGENFPSGVLATAEVFDPMTKRWAISKPMNVARKGHTSTLLRDGRVLVAGNSISVFSTNLSAELYDPKTGKWVFTTAPLKARTGHTATVLEDGTVLVVGGDNARSAELYHPVTETWTPTGNTLASHYSDQAVLMRDGKVLIAGRNESLDPYIGTISSPQSEIWDPATGNWSATGNLQVSRAGHTSTLLADGKVLVVGGAEISQTGSSYLNTRYLSDTELYDPLTKPLWKAVRGMTSARYSHATVLLGDGKVLVAGGVNPTFDTSATPLKAELYDPVTESWSTNGAFLPPRSGFTMTLLSNGKVLMVGGSVPYNAAPTQLYDPTNKAWVPVVSPNFNRTAHTANLLRDGTVLVTGGGYAIAGGSNSNYSASQAELYDPNLGTWTIAGPTNLNRAGHQATMLADGKVLVTGGTELANFGSTLFAGFELYDPVKKNWVTSGPLNQGRFYHNATLLPNGKVLLSGGAAGMTILSSAELYDPATGRFEYTGSMNQPHYSHQAVVTGTGKVLVFGGVVSFGVGTATVELYDPNSGSWELVGSMRFRRVEHTATVLADGKVLIVGGYDPKMRGNYSFSALGYTEIFDPSVVTLPLKLRMQLVGGSPSLSLIGSVGTSYAVEYKNGLLDGSWSPLASFTMTTNPATVADPAMTGATTRYYRATVR